MLPTPIPRNTEKNLKKTPSDVLTGTKLSIPGGK
jgi:hypothetical protein